MSECFVYTYWSTHDALGVSRVWLYEDVNTWTSFPELHRESLHELFTISRLFFIQYIIMLECLNLKWLLGLRFEVCLLFRLIGMCQTHTVTMQCCFEDKYKRQSRVRWRLFTHTAKLFVAIWQTAEYEWMSLLGDVGLRADQFSTFEAVINFSRSY